MTKTTYFKTLLAAIVMLTLSINTWADTYSYTFTAKAWSAYDSQTLSNITWTATATGGGYWGYDTTKGQQFGSSSSPATTLSLTTSGIAGTITSIKVNTSGASSVAGTVSISVGGTAFTSGSSTSPALTSTATDYTFTGSGSGNVAISYTQTSSKALYIKSIEITYTTVVTAVPVVTAGSPSGTVGAAFSYNISATNTPTSYALVSGTLPAGLSLTTTTGAITGTPTAAGASSMTVTATNSVGTSAAATLSCSIAKASQTITFGALDSKTIQDAAFDLTATASSGLAVSYSSSNTAVATVIGSTVTIVGIGSTSITASQAGNENYNAATPVSQTLTVGQYVAPTITITEITVPTFVSTVGNADHQTINISGVNLTANVSLALSGANADQFSLSQTSIAQSGGVAPNTAITINYTPTTAGTHTATLTFSSAGAIDVTRTLSGTASWITLTAPTATAATAISTNGFTANWNAVEGATEYQLEVYYESGGVGNITASEGFDNAPTAPTDWIFTNIASTYTSSGNYGTSSPAIKFDATGDALTTPTLLSTATSLSFWLKGQTSTSSIFLVEGTTDGSIWTTIESITTPSNTAKTYIYTSSTSPALPTNMKQFRFSYTKVTSNVAFDDVSCTFSLSGQTTVNGSPFTVTETNKALSGLGSATIYKYTVIAKNAHSTSEKSNIISVETAPTGLNTPEVLSIISATNGSIKFIAAAGETVEVYNTIGQKLVQQKTHEGANTIQLRNQGVLLVKVGTRVGKVIL